ncbi:MAG: Cell division protein FtsX [Parcubacteria group bacterium ADurb.Bin247]|nr:MAG: Cell division protein FtsX [Parcubacteria group bacterium ADurb.Bin247]
MVLLLEMKWEVNLDYNIMFTILKRTLKLAWNNLKHNSGLFLVAVFAIAIVLIFTTFAFVIQDFAQSVSSEIKQKVSVSVYFKDGVDEDTIMDVKSGLEELPDVVDVSYTSTEDALESFIQRYKNDPLLMAALAEVGNPFPASISVSSDSVEGYDAIVYFLEDSPSQVFFEKIDYGQRKPIIEDLFYITDTVKKAGLLIAVIMSLIAILVVFNIIKSSIRGMRDEISIMRLVGVSRNFLFASFTFQGLIIGLFSIALSFLITIALVFLFGEDVKNIVFGLDVANYLEENSMFLLQVHVFVAFMLGVISSILAVTRYLKV